MLKLIKYQHFNDNKNNLINLFNIYEESLNDDIKKTFIIIRNALKIINDNEESFLTALDYLYNNIPENINERKIFYGNDIDTWKKYWLDYIKNNNSLSLKQFINYIVSRISQTNDLSGISLLTVNTSKVRI